MAGTAESAGKHLDFTAAPLLYALWYLTHLQTFLTLKIHASENSTVTKSAKKSFSRHRQGIKNKPRQEDVSSVAAPEALSECRGTALTGERWHSQGRAGTKGEWKGQSHFMDVWAPLRLRAFPRTRPSLSNASVSKSHNVWVC